MLSEWEMGFSPARQEPREKYILVKRWSVDKRRTHLILMCIQIAAEELALLKHRTLSMI